MSLARTPTDGGASPRQLLLLAIPAIVIGAFAALLLWVLEQLADLLGDVVWETLPDALGVDPSGWWIVLILTLTGLAVGICLRFLPGHGGPDSATTELIGPPLPLKVLPGLAIVTVLGLAGGVSLGPENPIIAINCAIAVALFARLLPQVPAQISILIAGAATVGALFGTPVAAALLFTGIVAAAKGGGSLWDRLFLPVAAAGAGAITMHLLGLPAARVRPPRLREPAGDRPAVGGARRVRGGRHRPGCARRVPDRLPGVPRPAAPHPDPARRRVRARHPRPHRRPHHDVQGTQADRRAAAGSGPVRRRPARA